MPGGVRTEIHLTGDDTDGTICLLIDSPPTGWSLPAHRHRREVETIHIIEGEFEMEVDGQQYRLTAGDTIHIPRGVVHAGGNVGEQPGRRVVAFTPAGIEGFFLEAGTAAPDADVDLATATASAARYGWEFIT